MAGRPITDDLELLLAVMPPPLRSALEGEAQKVKIPFQVIFTTSMPDDSLEGSNLTVGPRYSRQSKTLANIVTRETDVESYDL